jgi:phytoene/squalene synthetase
MIPSLASSITKAASKQTYYTIRFLVDRGRVEDAYRAYAYFRWVDDTLDANSGPAPARMAFVQRQKSLLEKCYRRETPRDAATREMMLVELVRCDREKNSGLQVYLRSMMQVMDFDARRRGGLISKEELNDYTRWLATAVMECIHHFIGHNDSAPHGEARYLAVSAAHMTHMLRDTFDDLQAGYYNIPREVLEENRIEPQDVQSNAYCAWVKSRVQLARENFKAGKDYFAQVKNPRCRLACLAYISRFEWLLDTIEKEDYCLRPSYKERKRVGIGVRMSWLTLSSMLHRRGADALSRASALHPLGKQ